MSELHLCRYFRRLTGKIYLKRTGDLHMEPTCRKGDWIFGYRMRGASRIGIIEKGNIVIVSDKKFFPDFRLLRVIGLPGERIKIANGETYIDKAPLVGSNKWNIAKDSSNYKSRSIPSLEYFLMGDNRSKSVDFDSRKFGPVPFIKIRYKALIAYRPLCHFKILV